MAEYHVGCGLFGIYAGVLSAKNKTMWKDKTECTGEAISAVRDYLFSEAEKRDEKRVEIEWPMKDGRNVILTVEIAGKPNGEPDE